MIDWIPVSSGKLPDDFNTKEVTIHWEIWAKGKIFDQGDGIGHSLYDTQDFRGAGWYRFDKHKTPVEHDYPNMKARVTAWRELPAPYKEEIKNTSK